MAALAGQVVNWPSGGAPPSMYDAATGRPAYHESNVLIECRIRVEGELATFREAIDPFLWAERFSTDQGEFDWYIDYALTRAFGLMMRDPRLGPLIRAKVWIVKPDDEHDFQRCAQSERTLPAWQDPGALGPVLADQAPGGPVPYCHEGVIVQPPRPRTVNGARRMYPVHEPLGACPCRCHLRDGSYERAEMLVRMHRRFPMNWDPRAARFDEDQLDEDGAPR